VTKQTQRGLQLGLRHRICRGVHHVILQSIDEISRLDSRAQAFPEVMVDRFECFGVGAHHNTSGHATIIDGVSRISAPPRQYHQRKL
jgi:hypothetical protein